jgi:hypothetical protein
VHRGRLEALSGSHRVAGAGAERAPNDSGRREPRRHHAWSGICGSRCGAGRWHGPDGAGPPAPALGGRIRLDEPTDLPDGTVVPLEIAEDWDDLDDEERAALHESLRESIEQMKAGQTIGIEEALAELRAHQ